MLGMVTRAASTAEAWRILGRTFQAQSGARQMYLRQQLQSMTKGSMSVLDYFERKSSLVDSLSDSLCIISDEEFVGFLLYGLGTQFLALRSAISLRSDPVTSDELLGILLQEEAVLRRKQHRFNHQRQTQPTAPPAIVRLHLRRHRLLLKANARSICQVCTKLGHEALNCYNRLNLKAFPPTNRTAAAKLRNVSSGKSAFMVSSSILLDLGDPWYVDSGATHHVTFDAGNISLQTVPLFRLIILEILFFLLNMLLNP